jgi:hypothetical protein
MTAISLGSLQDLNCNAKFDIKQQLNIFLGDDDDVNIFKNVSSKHSYHDLLSIKNSVNRNNPVLLSCNVCSLKSKHGVLISFVDDLKNRAINICIIAVQETWNIQIPELVQIPGFKLVYKLRHSIRGGGVAFYIKDNVKFKIMDNFSHFIEKTFECLTVELTINKKHTSVAIFTNHLIRP